MDRLIKRLGKIIQSQLEDLITNNSYHRELKSKENEFTQYEIMQFRQKEKEIENKAKSIRKELIYRAKIIKEWTERARKARSNNAIDLAEKADKYIQNLIESSKEIWEDFDELGKEFEANKTKLLELSNPLKDNASEFKTQFSKLEIEKELEKIRQGLDL